MPSPDAQPASAGRKVDIHNHVMPAGHLVLVRARYKDAGLLKRLTSIRLLRDMEARDDAGPVAGATTGNLASRASPEPLGGLMGGAVTCV